MRKLGTLLTILLLLTAYGRCVADQLGALHSSGSACCQVISDQSDHCSTSQPEESPSAESCDDHYQDSDHDSHSDESTPDQSDNCGLCLILSSDSMLLSAHIKVPVPVATLLELTPLFYAITLDDLLDKSSVFTQLDNLPDEHSNHPAEHRSQLRRVIAKTTPVRGPSIV